MVGLQNHAFVLPRRDGPRVVRGTAQAFTHKGEWLQGPIPIQVDSTERYTMGVFSLLDDLNSAYVEVIKSFDPASSPSLPTICIAEGGWNAGELAIITKAVLETWRELAGNETCRYDVYGLHDVRVGAGSGSSSALAQAVIRATAAEHVASLSDETLQLIHQNVEPARDSRHLGYPAVAASRYRFGRPIKPLGHRTPHFKAVAWSAGDPVATLSVRFEYSEEEQLQWRVRWASLERAVRSYDDDRVARLSMESACECNKKHNKLADFDLLNAAVKDFGARGFAIAHTGSYHVALFGKDDLEGAKRFQAHVLANSFKIHEGTIECFDTAEAVRKRWNP
jgi:uncharacterized protein involved in propanediol utilization